MEKGPSDIWKIDLTPEKGTSIEMQKALDWWHGLPIQDLRYGVSWANLCMRYHPKRTECYHFTGEEVLYMWKQEHGKIS